MVPLGSLDARLNTYIIVRITLGKETLNSRAIHNNQIYGLNVW